jgi:hypothetical protein
VDGLNLDEKSLGKRQKLQHCQSIVPKKSQGMTNNVGLTFSVGDTTLQIGVLKLWEVGELPTYTEGVSRGLKLPSTMSW